MSQCVCNRCMLLFVLDGPQLAGRRRQPQLKNSVMAEGVGHNVMQQHGMPRRSSQCNAGSDSAPQLRIYKRGTLTLASCIYICKQLLLQLLVCNTPWWHL